MPRSLARLLAAPLKAEHYRSLRRSAIYLDWWEFFLRRYVLGRGGYPFRCRISTPTGDIALTVHGHDDCFTVNEIFGLECYAARDETIVVDFGSNIGISAAYFLTRNATSVVYCYEPLARNARRLIDNLAPFAGRFHLCQAAVMDAAGSVQLRIEPTGRYCGIECTTGELETFPCVSAGEELDRIVARHGRIDLLKIDVEGAEAAFFPTLPPAVLARIGVIYIESRHRFRPPGFEVTEPVKGVLRYRRARSIDC